MNQGNRTTRRALGLAGVLALGALVAPAARAGTEISFADWVTKVTVKGDIRLRSDSEIIRQGVDRNRQRMRIRLQGEIPVSPTLKTVFGIASGEGEQTSTNQSFKALSSQKALWIDLAYLEYKPMETFRITAGRMKNPLWLAYSDDAVWDGDFNPEGLAQNLKLSLFGSGRVFLNGLQGVADEDSASPKDQFYFTEQLGVIWPLPADSRITVAGAVTEWVNESSATRKQLGSAATFQQVKTQDGNRRLGTGLANEFRVMELTAEYLIPVFDRPLSVQGTYVKNLASLDVYTDKADRGNQVGLIYGKASGKGKWEAAYFHKQLATDATVADVADSDFGVGGTNRRGHLAWFSYAPADYAVAQVKFFNTKLNDVAFNSGKPKDVNRLQIDFSVKF